MEKSIETLWKEGFASDDVLIAPKVNNLYNKKSNNIIDRMLRLMKWNVIGIYIFAFLFLVYSLFSSTPLVPAISVFLMFIIAGWYTDNQRKTVKDIDKNLTSYEYLKSFQQWLKDQIARNITLSRYFYPLSFVAAFSMVWFGKGREEMIAKFIEKFPNHIMISDMPLIFLLFLVFGTLMFIVFAKHIYTFDVRLVYGRVFNKLNEIITDFEELRK